MLRSYTFCISITLIQFVYIIESIFTSSFRCNKKNSWVHRKIMGIKTIFHEYFLLFFRQRFFPFVIKLI